MTEAIDELTGLRERVSQLEHALESRIAIEQAKGILAERYRLDLGEAFELLRYAARTARISVQELSRRVVPGGVTPPQVTIGLARQQRWRAAAQRERAELHRERARVDTLRTKLG